MDSMEHRSLEPVQVNSGVTEYIAQAADHYASMGTFKDFRSRLTQNTRRRHLADLTLFTRYLAQAGIHLDAEQMLIDPETWVGITWGLVEGYVKWMLREGYAMGSINVRLFTVRAYCRLAAKAGIISSEGYGRISLVRGYSPTHGRNADRDREITRRGTKKSTSVSISRDQASRLKKDHADSPQGRRDALLMCILLDHGLRCGEIASLTPENINLVDGTLVFYRSKVDKTQMHELTKDTRNAAMKYFQVYTQAEKLLAGSRKSGNLEGVMSERAINERVRVLGEAVGLVGLSPHDARHYWATSAVRGGTDIKSLQDAGGWSSPAMPLRYAESSTIANQGVKLG